MREPRLFRALEPGGCFDQAGHHQRSREIAPASPDAKPNGSRNGCFESMKKALEQGDRIELRGFARFSM